MAIVMSNDVTLTVGGTDLSDWVQSIVVSQDAEDLDATGMGATSRAHARGLRDDRIEVTFLQDFAASAVDATLSALYTSTGFAVVVKPTSSAVSSTNPTYTMTGLLLNYQPIDATVGEISTPDVTFVPAPGSSIVRATS